MRKNFGPQSWLYPMPVLVVGTYDRNDNPNAMTAAWGGIFDTNLLAICIDPGHKTAENLKYHRAFTVSVGDLAHVRECDYLGLASGNKEPDKLKKADLHTRCSDLIHAPVIEEFPLTLECRVISYNETTGSATAEILNISADDSILGEDGNISLEKFRPVTYDPVHQEYLTLGESAGTAFKLGLDLD
jgi:flavin reductase (DIM6/NTAB) family NADH-FMN oxidoreductase RutF